MQSRTRPALCSQHVIAGLRSELTSANTALDTAQEMLRSGDRVLAEVESGLAVAEHAVRAGRRAFPAILVVAGLAVAAVVVVVVVRRRRIATHDSAQLEQAQ